MPAKPGMRSGRKGNQYVKYPRIKYEISLSGARLAYWRGQAVAILGREPTEQEIVVLARDGTYSWLNTLAQ